jgi:hypothetical protein
MAKPGRRSTKAVNAITADDIPMWFVELTRLVLKNCSGPGRFIIELEIPSADEEPREVQIYQRVMLSYSLVDNRVRPRDDALNNDA